MVSLFGQLKTIAWTCLIALVITMLAGGVWTALLVANLTTSPSVPWVAVVMAVVLWLLWLYLGGKWWPYSTSHKRRALLRANPISFCIFWPALLAGLSAVVGLAGFWIVLFDLVDMPGNVLPDFSSYPMQTVAILLAMASIVSSVVEEIGFRGYLQGALERVFNAPLAIGLQCLVIALPHGLTQGFNWPTLLFYLLVDILLGTTAYLTNSILPGIAIHITGLLVFFAFVWPGDQMRRVVANGTTGSWFWIHVAQTVIFAAAAILIFVRLSRLRSQAASNSP
jgi:membrane protease YdiL (CAAX protease family)